MYSLLYSLVYDDQVAKKNTSADVDSQGISDDEKGPASIASDKDPLAVTDNNDNYENRSTAVDGQRQIFLSKKVDADTAFGEDESKTSNAKSSSQSKEKQQKKKKASKGRESAQNNTEGKKTNNEEQTSSEGI